MEPLDSVQRWSERVRDRARMRSFFLFLWRRFLDDRLFESAGALAYASVRALRRALKDSVSAMQSIVAGAALPVSAGCACP